MTIIENTAALKKNFARRRCLVNWRRLSSCEKGGEGRRLVSPRDRKCKSPRRLVESNAGEKVPLFQEK